MRGLTDDSVQLLQALDLFVHEQFRVANDVDQQDVRDLQREIGVLRDGHEKTPLPSRNYCKKRRRGSRRNRAPLRRGTTLLLPRSANSAIATERLPLQT